MALGATEWRTVISHMPVIGNTHSAARLSDRWSHEHKGVDASSADTLSQLQTGNIAYEAQFGFRYVVFATGRSGDELLELLQSRLSNSPEIELQVAATELAKITQLRLINSFEKSPITTHVLNTSSGKPASHVKVTLSDLQNGEWRESGQSVTNHDGRVINFIPRPSLNAGADYKILFQVDGSFFSPIQIAFRADIADEHYHVPLLVSPFGYTTYRGS
jgi:hydroxyisourate hydrolase